MQKVLKSKIFVFFLIFISFFIYFLFSNKAYQSYKTESVDININNCKNLPELPDGAERLVTRVIDGDTFVIEGGYSIRILGINADEKGYSCYQPAKEFLESLILNKKVKLYKGSEDKDEWCRYLRYVFVDGKNVGLELVKNGLAIAYFSHKDDKYQKEIILAEKNAIENKIGCKWGSEIGEEKEYKWKRLTTENLGFDVISACSAIKYLGRKVIVEGKVVDTYYHTKSGTVFLNFENPYPNQCFTGVIFKSDLEKFPSKPENYYLGKKVRIFGEIKEYKGKPEIILKSPLQIEIGDTKH